VAGALDDLLNFYFLNKWNFLCAGQVIGSFNRRSGISTPWPRCENISWTTLV